MITMKIKVIVIPIPLKNHGNSLIKRFKSNKKDITELLSLNRQDSSVISFFGELKQFQFTFHIENGFYFSYVCNEIHAMSKKRAISQPNYIPFLFFAHSQGFISATANSNENFQAKNILNSNRKDGYSDIFLEEEGFDKHTFQFYLERLVGTCYYFNVWLCFLYLINKLQTYPKISNGFDFG
jgi:hypothetical protein